jgi:hypothetical protein
MKVWPDAALSCCAAQRAWLSVGPAGAKGMMMRTGFAGHAGPPLVEGVCAAAGAIAKAIAQASAREAPCFM